MHNLDHIDKPLTKVRDDELHLGRSRQGFLNWRVSGRSSTRPVATASPIAEARPHSTMEIWASNKTITDFGPPATRRQSPSRNSLRVRGSVDRGYGAVDTRMRETANDCCRRKLALLHPSSGQTLLKQDLSTDDGGKEALHGRSFEARWVTESKAFGRQRSIGSCGCVSWLLVGS